MTTTFLYYGKAALHTFWQAALASLIGAFGGSGLNLAHLPQVSDLEKLGIAAAVAGLAAVMSYVKQLIVLPKPGTTPATDTGSDVSLADLAATTVVPPIDPPPVAPPLDPPPVAPPPAAV